MKKMTGRRKVAVLGAAGRMGQEISELLKKSPVLAPALGIVRTGNAPNFIKVSRGLDRKEFSEIDVVIDFSSAASFSENIKFAMEQKIPLVSGVTGISKSDLLDLKKASAKIPILWSANMSLGIAILTQAMAAFKGVSEFDFQIEEIHHNKKKDAPSGTAILLQSVLEETVLKKCPKPVSIRGGGVFGIHKIFAISDNEMISFEHTSLNRRLFAEGALKAAQWILNKKPGLYEMKDIFLP